MSGGTSNKFITPEVIQGDSSDSNNGNGEQAKEAQLILASADLPARIYIIPSVSKPVFPGILFPVMLKPGSAANALKRVVKDVPERIVGIVLTQSEDDHDTTDGSRLHRIGVAARILRLQESEDGGVQALLQGEKRMEILKASERDGVVFAQVVYLEDIPGPEEESKAMAMAIISTLRDLTKHNPLFSEEIKQFIGRQDWDDPGRLADFAVTMTSATRDELQGVLECLEVKKRLEKVLFFMRKELDINQLKERITKQIEEKISQQQREFFLREQLKAIKQELGMEKDEKTEEIEKYRERLEHLDLNPEAQSRVDEEIDKLQLLSPNSPEFSVSRNYLDWLTSLPWGVFSDDQLDVGKARKVLDRDHYGLEDVKKRILEFIGVAKLRGGVEGSILCLIGPPGVGKTSLGRAVAESLGREFYRFSLGGMRDEAEIKGHRRTYIGAMPGKVMQAIKTVGVANPVIMLDEIDKVGSSFQGDPASALLEVLDPEQNYSFRDHYLDVPFDLSKVLFIATANVPDTIPGPLMDRMETIRLSGYILEEKLSIAKRHLVPRLLKKHSLEKSQIRFTDGALKAIIDGHAREAGVRAFEKAVSACMRKVAAEIAEGTRAEQAVIKTDNLDDFLGKPRFSDEAPMKRMRPGVAMGLAWTPLGGSNLYIEAIEVPGTERAIKLTGQLGDVMVESSHIAFSVVGNNLKKWGVGEDFFRDKTIHLHVPAGATPKDGPSAGITMASALVSLGRNEKLPSKLAMTGELTLTGRVLPVGGIKEKVIAARRAKVKHVILPAENEKDFIEIPEHVREGVIPHYVDDYSQVFKLLFKDGLQP
jgi:ATP-dependent Lon protease